MNNMNNIDNHSVLGFIQSPSGSQGYSPGLFGANHPEWFTGKTAKEIKDILEKALTAAQDNITKGDDRWISSEGKGNQSHYKNKLTAITNAINNLKAVEIPNQGPENKNENNLENENEININTNQIPSDGDIKNKQHLALLADIYNDVRTALSKKWNWFGISDPQSLKTFDNSIKQQIDNYAYYLRMSIEHLIQNNAEIVEERQIIPENKVLIKITNKKYTTLKYIEHEFQFPPRFIRLKVGGIKLSRLFLAQEDFLILKDRFHEGAFGNDFQFITINNRKFFLVWKFPADLYGIGSEKGGVAFGDELPVGTYEVVGPVNNAKDKKFATKLRSDFKIGTEKVLFYGKKDGEKEFKFNKIISIHRFRFDDGRVFQGIGVSPYFVNNLVSPTDIEMRNLNLLVKELADIGLVVSNSLFTHHALVFMAHGGKCLTAKSFRNLLNDKEFLEKFIEVMRKHLICDASKFDEWIGAIQRFRQ